MFSIQCGAHLLFNWQPSLLTLADEIEAITAKIIDDIITTHYSKIQSSFYRGQKLQTKFNTAFIAKVIFTIHVTLPV